MLVVSKRGNTKRFLMLFVTPLVFSMLFVVVFATERLPRGAPPSENQVAQKLKSCERLV
jgi:hypothetical protein